MNSLLSTAEALTALRLIADKDFDGYEDQLILWFGSCRSDMMKQIAKK